MEENRIITTTCTDPYRNLALEELLLSAQSEGVTLYLWQNSNTVVVGRNQNAWRECRIDALTRDGGRLARRTSGGGAVFHDMGNLNFTFLADKARYDIPRQLSVIVSAARNLGIAAEVSGRNDITTADGAKFSGNAFSNVRHASLHHGTLLIATDMDKLAKYLAPSREKLAAKGIASVRSRVVNLNTLAPVTVQDMALALKAAFIREYGAARTISPSELEGDALHALYAKHASYEWRLGKSPRCDVMLSHRFAWGELQLQLSCEGGRVTHLAAYSDAMDADMIQRLPAALTGCRLQSSELAAALPKSGGEGDIAAWLAGVEL